MSFIGISGGFRSYDPNVSTDVFVLTCSALSKVRLYCFRIFVATIH